MNSANLISVAVIGLVMATLSAMPVYAGSTEPSAILIAQVDANKDEQTKKAKKAKEKPECRRVRETGSRIASRICKKPSQWAREQENSRESVERSIEGARRNTSTGDS